MCKENPEFFNNSISCTGKFRILLTHTVDPGLHGGSGYEKPLIMLLADKSYMIEIGHGMETGEDEKI